MSIMSYVQRHPKTGVYWFRRAVPPELRAIIGKREIRKTLGTKKPDEAKRRALSMASEVDRLFTSARSGVTLSLADAQAIAAAWKAGALAKDAETRVDLGPLPSEQSDFEVDFLGDEWLAADEALRDGKAPPEVHKIIQGVLREQGLVVRPGTAEWRRLAHAFTGAAKEIIAIQRDRAGNDWSGEPPVGSQTVVVAPALSPLAEPVPSARRYRTDGKADVTLADVMVRWEKDRTPRPKTSHEFGVVVRRFNESVGQTLPVREITKQHVIKFLDDVAAMPRVLTNELRKKTIPTILAATAGNPTLERVSRGTLGKQFGALNTLLGMAVRYDFTERNPATGLKPFDTKSPREDSVFDTADLKLIFEQSSLYMGSKSAGARKVPGKVITRDAMFWLPLLCLYTGARLSELGQLMVSDVRHEDGIDYLDLNTLDEGKTLKNKQSRRRVPLHHELVRCGFLAYVAERRREGERQVFPELAPDKKGIWTSAISKRLNRYLDSIGIDERGKVVHSFRHTFKDACRKARVPESIHDALSGHTNGSVGRGYGRGEPLDALADAMKSVNYPVKLDHLHLSKETM